MNKGMSFGGLCASRRVNKYTPTAEIREPSFRQKSWCLTRLRLRLELRVFLLAPKRAQTPPLYTPQSSPTRTSLIVIFFCLFSPLLSTDVLYHTKMRSFRTAYLALAISASSGVSSAKPIVQTRDLTSGILSFDFAVHLNLSLGGSKIADLDRARASAKIPGLISRRDGEVGVTNAGVTYIAEVGVGEPSTSYSLLVDTGSSNTWIGKLNLLQLSCILLVC